MAKGETSTSIILRTAARTLMVVVVFLALCAVVLPQIFPAFFSQRLYDLGMTKWALTFAEKQAKKTEGTRDGMYDLNFALDLAAENFESIKGTDAAKAELKTKYAQKIETHALSFLSSKFSRDYSNSIDRQNALASQAESAIYVANSREYVSSLLLKSQLFLQKEVSEVVQIIDAYFKNEFLAELKAANDSSQTLTQIKPNALYTVAFDDAFLKSKLILPAKITAADTAFSATSFDFDHFSFIFDSVSGELSSLSDNISEAFALVRAALDLSNPSSAEEALVRALYLNWVKKTSQSMFFAISLICQYGEQNYSLSQTEKLDSARTFWYNIFCNSSGELSTAITAYKTFRAV